MQAKTEGEFKKRILEVANFSVDINPPYHPLSGEMVMKWVEEARKEFPLDSDKKYEGKLFSERNIILSGDRLQWFRKWFGEK